LIERAKGKLEFGVGGGIVWDSDAAAEHEETLTKARVLTQPRPDFQLLETMLWEPETGIFLFDDHMQRLGRSADYFDVPLKTRAIHRKLERVLGHRKAAPQRVRLLVSRDGAFTVQTFPWKHSESSVCRVALARRPVDSQDVFLFHKTTHRAAYQEARADFPECDDVILWNERGEVTEACIANVVIRRNGRLLTPPIECGLLAGTFRDHLIKSGEIGEQVISIDDLNTSDDIFLINSVRRWMKAVMLKKQDFQVERPVPNG